MNKITGIYGIHNIKTDEWYIGQSHNIYSRWQYHKKDLRAGKHHSYKLQNAWNLYKPRSFKFVILEEFESLYLILHDKERLDILLYFREKYYMDKYNSLIQGYNVEDTFAKIQNYTIELENKEYEQLNESEYITNIDKYKYLYTEDITQKQIKDFISYI